MALSKKTVSKHNLKRAERFKELGLCDADVAFAHPRFIGYAVNGDAACGLCDKNPIKWLFGIRFDVPDAATLLGKIALGITRTEVVDIEPVGSKCINDWLEAVPESDAKLEALKRWDVEMNKMKAEQKRIAVERLCVEAGYGTREAAYEAWLDLQKAVMNGTGTYGSLVYRLGKKVGFTEGRMLKRNASKMRWGSCAPGTAKQWLENLAKATTLFNTEKAAEPAADTSFDYGANVEDEPASAPAPAPDSVDPDSDAGLLGRAGAIIEQPHLLQNHLNDYCRGALKDIHQKVSKYGSFRSSKQRSFFKELVEKVEKAGATVTAKAVATGQPQSGPKLGEPGYPSASGIDGARY